MRKRIDIENIEEMRQREGIDDVELRTEIRGLKAGDFVRVTLLAGATSVETLLVRITSIRGPAFRGKLVDGPTCAGLSQLHVGSQVAFTTAHIHSLSKRPPAHE
jgi:hypothetical protein